MKVLLINPPREHEIIGNNPTIIEKERGFNPPLGLLYIAAFLEQRSRHEVSVIDAQVEGLSYGELRQRIREAKPDAVGLTAMTMTIIDVRQTIGIIKEELPDTLVLLGGPHVNIFPMETVNLPGVDYVVMGEGERIIVELLDRLQEGRDLGGLKGLIYKENGRIVNNGAIQHIEDLDSLPFPARHLVPYKKYNSLLSTGGIVTTVFSSRGCPFKCRFCDRPQMGKRFRARSAQNVVDELEQCVSMGIREFLIYDDTFTVNKQRVMDICDLILERKLDIGFDIRARVDTVTEPMLKKLKQAGCEGIHYGVEAGTPHILKVLNKGITLELAQQVFTMTKKAGIPTLAYFMIGNPQETLEDIEETFRVIRRLNPDFVHMTVLTPFPGTQVYFDALEQKLIPTDVWKEFAENPTPDFSPPHWPQYFTREELNKLLVKGYKGFYLRPGYILKRIAKLRSWAEFKKKARAGLKVLGMK